MIDCQPQLHMVAIHAEAGYRSEVPGLAVLCVKEDLIVSAGQYQNSVGDASTYAVVGQYLGKYKDVSVGYVVGTVNGYRANNGNFIPMAGAVASIPWGDTTLHFTFIPPVQNYTPALVQISVSFKGIF